MGNGSEGGVCCLCVTSNCANTLRFFVQLGALGSNSRKAEDIFPFTKTRTNVFFFTFLLLIQKLRDELIFFHSLALVLF